MDKKYILLDLYWAFCTFYTNIELISLYSLLRKYDFLVYKGFVVYILYILRLECCNFRPFPTN